MNCDYMEIILFSMINHYNLLLVHSKITNLVKQDMINSPDRVLINVFSNNIVDMR